VRTRCCRRQRHATLRPEIRLSRQCPQFPSALVTRTLAYTVLAARTV